MRATVTLHCKSCDKWPPLPFDPKFEGQICYATMCTYCGVALSGKKSSFDADGRLIACAACGGTDLYRKKSFPKALGIGVVAVAAAATIVLAMLQNVPPWAVYAPLFAAAAIDAVLFFVTPDAIGCYRCPAIHRGYPLGREVPPFDHAKAEQMRHEPPRASATASKT